MAEVRTTLRLDDALVEALDQLAREMGYVDERGRPNRSAAVRHLIRRATGDSAVNATLLDERDRIMRRLREAEAVIWEDVLGILRRELLDAAPAPTIEPLPAGAGRG